MKDKNKKTNKEKASDHVEEMKAFIERKNAENKVLEKLLQKIKTTSSNKNKK